MVLTAKKNAALVAASNEMLNFPDSAVEDTIASNMARTLGTNEDIAFLRGTGLVNQPLGLTNLAGNSLAAGAYIAGKISALCLAVLAAIACLPKWFTLFNLGLPNTTPRSLAAAKAALVLWLVRLASSSAITARIPTVIGQRGPLFGQETIALGFGRNGSGYYLFDRKGRPIAKRCQSIEEVISLL